jgi:uncharacterized membrane protein YkvI
MSGAAESGSTFFQRFLLPGLAFKAVVIGGGYATGRELVEFFLPSGPWGGLAAIALATCVWSLVCAATFLFARATGSLDYRTFFQNLLGPGWVVFEVAYFFLIILILAVFGAAAGALGSAALGWPEIVGTLLLVAGIVSFAAFGNASVERLFKWVSVLLYGVYAAFLVLALLSFGDRIAANFSLPAQSDGWILGGLTYAGYNVVGAVVILPVVRHMTSSRDAIAAGLIAGPLAMLPALLFFVCMIAYYPAIGTETLPSDFLLAQLDLPAFRLLFQLMIFSALLESGTGLVHAINERLDKTWQVRRGTALSAPARLGIAGLILVGSIFLATRFGLVALIAEGYAFFGYVILAIFVLPLATIGVARILKPFSGGAHAAT